ncbi:MAG: nucleoside hydrolase [Candidatus Rokubacteria bacterium]|nr:nucleoside hydrolase [Candidatus Rokubacteria bacterium]
MSIPLLIDTDPGIDDALAILLALGSPEVRVEAITTVAGNVPVDRATINTLRLLAIRAPLPRPRVAQGAAAPLRQSLESATHIHGADGLGNTGRLPGEPGPPATTLEMLDGPDLILEMAGRFRGELVVAALGPLTNLALALERDPDRLRGVRRVVVMGGAVTVPGNVTAAAEFNFYVDPDAAERVFASGLPLELVPLDVTRHVVLRREALERRLDRAPGLLASFVRAFTRHGFEVGGGEGGIVMHDPLAIGIAVDPSLVAFEALAVAIETEGRHTRGLSLADRRAFPGTGRPRPNCRVAQAVDARRFLDRLLERLCLASS